MPVIILFLAAREFVSFYFSWASWLYPHKEENKPHTQINPPQPWWSCCGQTADIWNEKIIAVANGAGTRDTCPGLASPASTIALRRVYDLNVKHRKSWASKVTFGLPSPLLVLWQTQPFRSSWMAGVYHFLLSRLCLLLYLALNLAMKSLFYSTIHFPLPYSSGAFMTHNWQRPH